VWETFFTDGGDNLWRQPEARHARGQHWRRQMLRSERNEGVL